ncbi:MAG: DUF1150 family protein [Pseudomonadota bacterium]
MDHPVVSKFLDKQIVYVREADKEDLPDELKSEPGPFFAVHNQDGTCLALAKDRGMAFHLARQNDLTPVSVH